MRPLQALGNAVMHQGQLWTGRLLRFTAGAGDPTGQKNIGVPVGDALAIASRAGRQGRPIHRIHASGRNPTHRCLGMHQAGEGPAGLDLLPYPADAAMGLGQPDPIHQQAGPRLLLHATPQLLQQGTTLEQLRGEALEPLPHGVHPLAPPQVQQQNGLLGARKTFVRTDPQSHGPASLPGPPGGRLLADGGVR